MTGTSARPLSRDLAAEILAGGATVALVAIVGVDTAPAGTGRERGELALRVLDTLRGEPLPPSIRVPFRRAADPWRRERSRDAWDRLALVTGELLLLALAPTADPVCWSATAVHEGESPAAVAAVREAIRIDALEPTPRARREALARALTSREDVLRAYALHSLASGRIVPVDEGVALVEAVLASASDERRSAVPS